jgi:hypothetical protein
LVNVWWRCAASAGCLLLAAASAAAQPGDAQAVARARKDYALAMKGHDVGLQNAMRQELAAQLDMSRNRAAPRPPSAQARQQQRPPLAR